MPNGKPGNKKTASTPGSSRSSSDTRRKGGGSKAGQGSPPTKARSTAPTGSWTGAILMMDIVGYSLLKTAEAQVAALKRLDLALRTVRDLRSPHVYLEPREGDSRFLLFRGQVEEATHAGFAILAAVRKVKPKLQIRLALHFGSGQTADGKPVGRPVSEAARVMSEADPGVVAVSTRMARELKALSAEYGSRIEDLGTTTVKHRKPLRRLRLHERPFAQEKKPPRLATRSTRAPSSDMPRVPDRNFDPYSATRKVLGDLHRRMTRRKAALAKLGFNLVMAESQDDVKGYRFIFGRREVAGLTLFASNDYGGPKLGVQIGTGGYRAGSFNEQLTVIHPDVGEPLRLAASGMLLRSRGPFSVAEVDQALWDHVKQRLEQEARRR